MLEPAPVVAIEGPAAEGPVAAVEGAAEAELGPGVEVSVGGVGPWRTCSLKQ